MLEKRRSVSTETSPFVICSRGDGLFGRGWAADGPVSRARDLADLGAGGRPVEVLASARGGDSWMWGELTVALEPDGDWALIDGPTAVPARPPAWKLVLAPMEIGEQGLPLHHRVRAVGRW
jgi:hypothetical protein